MDRLLTEVDRAYLAGFFDADGAIMACIEKHSQKKFGFRIRLYVKIAQKHKIFFLKFRHCLAGEPCD